jgi:nucleoside-diphosphate-sugar epimerase
MSPLASRDPVFFARLEQKRPIPIPGEGLALVQLIHVADVARCMAAVIETPRSVGETYTVTGREAATVTGMIHLMARAVGVEPRILHVPMEAARRAQPPLVHWGEAITGSAYFSIDKALRELPWSPQLGLADGYRDSYEWFVREGRSRYTFDFARDDALIARYGGHSIGHRGDG